MLEIKDKANIAVCIGLGRIDDACHYIPSG